MLSQCQELSKNKKREDKDHALRKLTSNKKTKVVNKEFNSFFSPIENKLDYWDQLIDVNHFLMGRSIL